MQLFTKLISLPPLTISFLVVIGLITIWFHISYKEKTVEFGPTILTTTGIFATFFGIAVGLYDFNVSNIQASVPSLLDGLKTAFWASVAGVGGALTLKYRHYLFGVKSDHSEVGDDDGSVEDVVRELSAIKYALAGQEDTSLVSQIKLLRSDTNDRLDALKKAQSESLEMLSKMGTQAIIEALRDVIRDFNSKINEQFGENFKHLNQAVAKLVVWQEQNAKQIDDMTQQLSKLIEVARTATENHKNVVDQTSAFSKTASDLSDLLRSLETQKQQLQAHAKSLAQLFAQASDAIPKIEKNITEIANQMASSSDKTQKILTDAIVTHSLAIQKNIETTTSASAKLLEESSITIQRTLQNASASATKSQEEHMRQIGQLIAKSKEQIDQLDAALAEELGKSLEALGRQLAALSERFVEDYQPLTEKLRQIVQIASRVQ